MERENADYVRGYSIIIVVMIFFIFFLGLYLGVSINWIAAFICWGSGFVYILFVNILKDILQELRKK